MTTPTSLELDSIGKWSFAFFKANEPTDWKRTPRVTEDEEAALELETISRRERLDKERVMNIVKADRSSLTARSAHKRVGEDSSQHIPGGIHLPPGPRADDYSPGKGEESMPHSSSKATTGFAAVKTVLEPRPDDVLERLLVELSQRYPEIEPKELEGRLTNLSEVLAIKTEEIKKAYSWTRIALGVSVAFLCGIVLFHIIDAITKVPVPLFVNVLTAVAGTITGLLVIVAARVFYKVRREMSRHEFLQWSVNDRIGILKETQKLQAS